MNVTSLLRSVGLVLFLSGIGAQLFAQDEQIVLKTNIPAGDTIRLYTMPVDIDQDDIWIDLNNDGQMQESESINFQYAEIPFTVSSPTITIHGPIFQFGCEGQKIESLDLSKATSLTRLICSNNDLKTLGVSANTKLTLLHAFNNQLSAIDLKNNPLLEEVRLQKNKLTAPDLSHCPNLKHVHCYENKIRGEAMKALLASLPTRLAEDGADLYLINSTAKVPDGNYASRADVASVIAKHWVVFDFNSAGNPKEYAGSDELDKLYYVTIEHPVQKKIRLALDSPEAERANTWIDLNNDGVRQANESIPKFGATEFHEYSSTTKTLVIYGMLSRLDAPGNEITKIDLTHNPYVAELNVSNNLLSELNLSASSGLKDLDCSRNKLTGLITTPCTELRALSCFQNAINGQAAADLVSFLPYMPAPPLTPLYFINTKADPADQNECLPVVVDIAQGHGWQLMDIQGGDIAHAVPYTGKDTGVKDIAFGGRTIRFVGNSVIVSFTTEDRGKPILLYDMSGQLLFRGIITTLEQAVSLPEKEAAYVLQIGTQTGQICSK